MQASQRATWLRGLVAPRSVALVGASATAGKLTARPLTFLRKHGFSGRIYPVNPARATVMDLAAYPSVAAIPQSVDHAYILLDTEAAIAALKDCASAGVKVVSLLADGFAESGEEGRARQSILRRIAEDAGILLIGPNSTGVVATHSGFACTTNAAFAADELKTGRLAVLSQSGSLIGTILSRGQARGIGYSVLVSVGNEAAAGIGRIGDLLLDNPDTDGFVLFLETIRDRHELATFAAGAARAGKPVIAYVIGRSQEGQALSVSHTGALTGSREANAAFLREVGIRQVELFESLIEAPPALTRIRPVNGRSSHVTVVSTTGGGGAMLVDQLSARGVPIAGCSDASKAIFIAAGIPFGHGKLVDVTMAGTRYDAMKKVVSTLIGDPATGLLIVAIGSSAQFNPELAVKPIIDAVAEAPAGHAPVMALPLPYAPESLGMLEVGGVPAFRTVETCAETAALFLDRPKQAADAKPAAIADGVHAQLMQASPGTMDEVSAGEVFAALGLDLPPQIFLAPGAPLPDVLPFDFPVAAKLVSPDLPHKTEAGAVRINLADRAALQAAITEMQLTAERHLPGFRLSGILVQKMCHGVAEALIGLTRDPLVGPVVTLAMGGTMAEIYSDASVRPAPVSVATALEMIAEVKGFALLRGFRGRPRGDVPALAEAVSAISRLALCDMVAEAECNPILVREEGEGVVMIDALIRRGEADGVT